ncbi:MAG: hypothetical protein SOV61_06150 [Lachnospiraceae bacterium]|nr:hypothetical protein [Lachnospiraceae bacterium]
MKRKVLVTMLCLAISVSAIACGTENTTEQLEETATEQTTEKEEVIEEPTEKETETQEIQLTKEEQIEDAWELLGEFCTCYGIDTKGLTVNEMSDRVEENFGQYWDEEENQYNLGDGTFIEYSEKFISTAPLMEGIESGSYFNWFDEQDGELGTDNYSIFAQFNYETDLYQSLATDVKPSYIKLLDEDTAKKQGGIMPLFYKYQISTGKDFMTALGWEDELNKFINEIKEDYTYVGEKAVRLDTPYGTAKVRMEFDGTGLIYCKPAASENWDIDKDDDYYLNVMVWMENENAPMSFFWYIYRGTNNTSTLEIFENGCYGMDGLDEEIEKSEKNIEAREEHYELGDTIEIKNTYVGPTINSKKVYGNLTLVLNGINNDVLSGTVTIISAPDLLEKGRIFDTSRITCKFLDENYEFVQYAVGSCSFGKGNESGVTFNIKDADKVMYLELECELPDEACNIFVKLK